MACQPSESLSSIMSILTEVLCRKGVRTLVAHIARSYREAEQRANPEIRDKVLHCGWCIRALVPLFPPAKAQGLAHGTFINNTLVLGAQLRTLPPLANQGVWT